MKFAAVLAALAASAAGCATAPRPPREPAPETVDGRVVFRDPPIEARIAEALAISAYEPRRAGIVESILLWPPLIVADTSIKFVRGTVAEFLRLASWIGSLFAPDGEEEPDALRRRDGLPPQ